MCFLFLVFVKCAKKQLQHAKNAMWSSFDSVFRYHFLCFDRFESIRVENITERAVSKEKRRGMGRVGVVCSL